MYTRSWFTDTSKMCQEGSCKHCYLFLKRILSHWWCEKVRERGEKKWWDEIRMTKEMRAWNDFFESYYGIEVKKIHIFWILKNETHFETVHQINRINGKLVERLLRIISSNEPQNANFSSSTFAEIASIFCLNRKLLFKFSNYSPNFCNAEPIFCTASILRTSGPRKPPPSAQIEPRTASDYEIQNGGLKMWFRDSAALFHSLARFRGFLALLKARVCPQLNSNSL